MYSHESHDASPMELRQQGGRSSEGSARTTIVKEEANDEAAERRMEKNRERRWKPQWQQNRAKHSALCHARCGFRALPLVLHNSNPLRHEYKLDTISLLFIAMRS